MKLTWKQIDPFLKSPDPKARVVLVYGPDNGLMRERAKTIAKTVVDDLDDPFNVIALNTEILSEDPARLNDEATLPCYVEDERGVSSVIRETLSNSGYFINADAIHILAANVMGDRSRVRGEIEKLMLYMGDEKNISAEHVHSRTRL